ncbi:unnamed protein product [Parnassius apollo]|uniref:(apollo) hypothetical protein n=1 Tax=Parnassius apollo TaxID=110799 RepID=A0A8S3XHL1_PARAO|nr:unnamed protein product [Parnassius apollo]
MDSDRISRLLEDVSTSETSDIEGSYHDDEGEYGSNEGYRPSAQSAVNTALQSPEVEQPGAQKASDDFLPNDMDIFLQSPEMEQPAAQMVTNSTQLQKMKCGQKHLYQLLIFTLTSSQQDQSLM